MNSPPFVDSISYQMGGCSDLFYINIGAKLGHTKILKHLDENYASSLLVTETETSLDILILLCQKLCASNPCVTSS